MSTNHKSAYIVSIFIFIIILFFPASSSIEPSIDDQKSSPEKIKSGLAWQKSELKKDNKSQGKSGAVTGADKYISGSKAISDSLLAEINKSIDQGIKNIRIILNTTGDTEELSSSIEYNGGRILKKRPNFMAVEVPVDKVEQLIAKNSSIEYARLPFKFYPSEKITEGVNLTGADVFHDTIYKGSGVKVAVVDVGFKGLSDAISAGELPGGVITRDFSGNGLETEYVHGTACAEIIHDIAPDAELHLLKLGDEIDGYEVIDYCINNNIDIVSLSVGTFGSGPGDGTGPVDETFDQLSEAGILTIASAGNYSGNTYESDGEVFTIGSHWEGVFTDSDRDNYHEYEGYNNSVSSYNIIAAFPSWDDDGKSNTGEISILLRWNDWPVSNIDYDIYLYEFDYEKQEIGDLVASSETYQTGTQPPVEYISMDIPDNETEGRFFALIVKRYDSGTPAGTEMEIYLGGTSEFVPFVGTDGTINLFAIATPLSSITEPADSEKVLAVGAIDYTNWITGPQEEYSSRGPTNAWNGSKARTKPDIMGPDGVTTYTYGDSAFFGTSAAAPHVAGIAALELSLHPEMTSDQLKAFMAFNAIDMDSPGEDDLYGWGRARAPYSFPLIKSIQKISATEGSFTGQLDPHDSFGNSLAPIGDLNGDGITDLAVGAYWDGDGGMYKGAVWILFMDTDGTVKSNKKISDTEGNFTGIIDEYGDFGASLASIGDLNGDGIGDLAVGASGDDDGGAGKGAVWILFMDTDGTVKSNKKISDTEGNFTGIIDEYDNFGASLASIGDLNGDGIGDLAVGAPNDYGKGAVWILFMNYDGTVKTYQKISETEGNFAGTFVRDEKFGCAITSVSDLDGDGVVDLAVGARGDASGSKRGGAIWILFMNSNGTVKSHQKISETEGNFVETFYNNEGFGSSVASIGDLNGDGTSDLVTGTRNDEDGGPLKGAVWIILLNTDGTSRLNKKISDWEGDFPGTLDEGDVFGSSVASMGDLNGDGVIDLAVGASGDDDGVDGISDNGAVWILFLEAFSDDMDYDGMSDSWEIDYDLNPYLYDAREDPDGDGLINIYEYMAGTDPGVADTDNDGISDGNEDANHNGVIDPGETDPGNPDSDSDGMPDGWELQYGLNPLINDASGDPDGDNFSNIIEYQAGTNPDDNTDTPNRAPVAVAGINQTVAEGVIVTLDGSNSYDPDDSIVSCEWIQLDGPVVVLSDSTDVSPTFITPDVGPDGVSIKFKLTVTDNGGLTDNDTCIVNISWSNKSPAADSGDDQTADAGMIVTLDGSNSNDPDSTVISYEWTQISGPAVVLSDSSVVSPAFTAPNVDLDGEIIIFELTVTDSDGLRDSSRCEVKVNPVMGTQIMSLTNNWNLVSFCQWPSDIKVGSVLDAISGDYISVWAYTNPYWHSYDPTNPGFSNLKEMFPGKGYWINMSGNAELSIFGAALSEGIGLSTGWNLVGYNSVESLDTDSAISSISEYLISVWAYQNGQWKVYDPVSPGFSDLKTMEPGFGYWIKVRQACTWTLP